MYTSKYGSFGHVHARNIVACSSPFISLDRDPTYKDATTPANATALLDFKEIFIK